MDAEQIKYLIERIGKSEGASIVLDRDIALTQYPDARPLPNNDARISIWDGNGRTQLTVKPYTASIDAAMTLVPEGWSFEVRSSGTGDPGQASVWNPMRAPGHEEYRASNFATPALALCAAALRAKIILDAAAQ